MTTHAALSPSSRHRWQLCPGSARESLKYPDNAGPAAIDGTHSHTLLEHCVKNGLMDARSMIGQTMSDHDGEFTVDIERAVRVEVALEYVRNRVTVLMGMCNVIAERRVDPAPLLGRTDMSGTVDIQLHSDTLEIIDYKDGMHPVDAEGNPQLEQYVMGALAEFGLMDAALYPFKRVRMTIIQPKLAAKGISPISTHEVSVQEMIGMIPRMKEEAAATDNPEAPLVPGDVQCKYCKARGACSALAEQSMTQAGITFADLDVAKDAAAKEPTTMSDQQIRELVEAAPLLRSLLDAVETEALRRFEAGQNIEGLKVVRGRGSRSWSLGEEEIAEKLKKMGLPKDAIWKTTLVSPAQVEKVTWEATKGGEKVTKSLSERQLKVIEGEYIKKSEGKLTIASLSDKRPAVTLNAAPLFSPVDEVPSWLS